MPSLKFVEDPTMPGWISLNFDVIVNNSALQASNCDVKVYFGFCEHLEVQKFMQVPSVFEQSFSHEQQISSY